jgi:hypothetical protein
MLTPAAQAKKSKLRSISQFVTFEAKPLSTNFPETYDPEKAALEVKIIQAREKQARIILGQAEVEIAHSFEKASHSYVNNPTALHVRAMNMLYEGLKEKGALMLVPGSAVESMGMGGLLGAAALRQQTLTESDEKPE